MELNEKMIGEIAGPVSYTHLSWYNNLAALTPAAAHQIEGAISFVECARARDK